MTSPHFFRPLPFVSITLVAACHFIGGTDGLYIDPEMGAQASGGNTAQTSTSTSSTSSSTGGGTDDPCQKESCPGEDSDCRSRACVDGQCSFVNAEPDTACSEIPSGGFCDDGQCVECTKSEHCAPEGTCQDNACYSAGCNDAQKNNGETDVDCGGPNCGRCPTGSACMVPGDCLSKLCDTTTNVCIACTSHEVCPTNNYCNFAVGFCRKTKPWFAMCDDDAECQSGHCHQTGNFCCQFAC